MLSPFCVGSEDRRKSMRRPAKMLEKRASCGIRRSATLARAITLSRAKTEAAGMAGSMDMGAKRPLTRIRAARPEGRDSKWMSEAPAATASDRVSVTKRITGPSSAGAASCAVSCADGSADAAGAGASDKSARTVRRAAPRGAMGRSRWKASSATSAASAGSAMRTGWGPSSADRGTAARERRKGSVRRAMASRSGGDADHGSATQGNDSAAQSAGSTTSSSANPRSIRTRCRGRPSAVAMVWARCRSSAAGLGWPDNRRASSESRGDTGLPFLIKVN